MLIPPFPSGLSDSAAGRCIKFSNYIY